jgi:hypothetical protein
LNDSASSMPESHGAREPESDCGIEGELCVGAISWSGMGSHGVRSEKAVSLDDVTGLGDWRMIRRWLGQPILCCIATEGISEHRVEDA